MDASNHITRVGITCALCHSTVDNSVMAGIGHRKDGWPNRDLNVGAIIALSPAVSAAHKGGLQFVGPGQVRPALQHRWQEHSALTLPPAYGLADVKNETYTAEGPISYWNAYVAVTQMHGRGNFSDPGSGIDIKHSPDMVELRSSPALRRYQHSLPAPPPPAGSFDARGGRTWPDGLRPVLRELPRRWHAAPTTTTGSCIRPRRPEWTARMRARTANKAYRTTPLRGLWQHPPYFHDGSAATLADVVAHYNGCAN